MNTIDLQIQTTASDGKHTPREVVAMAQDEKLETIAITDHDTVSGVEEGVRAGEEFGVRVIPGIEISVEERGAHILGYGIDCKNEALLAELEKSKQGRIEGARKMVENLKNAGFVVEWEDVVREATGAVVARPHLARAVLNRIENKEKLGKISTSHDFIQKYLTDDNPNYVRRTHIAAKDAITLIREAGGVAIWSHPAIHFYPVRSKSSLATITPYDDRTSDGVEGDYAELEEFLRQLIDWEIEGLEVFNPSHSEDDVEFIESLAAKYKLLRTAGSDFHEKGDHAPDARGLHSARAVGDYDTYGFSTEDIISNLDSAMAQHALPRGG
ncbi:MAG: phosphotransferase domain-containing protein [Parcubacteria group bacterium Gr01-1014_33]|nr:MAG: phosphotransferase domain-containing protein [Parcubacteria group bacterium Gr01-1014_33]